MACTVLRGGDDGNIIPLTRPFLRGYRFGTILVNLESHRVVDLLPDRLAETAAKWMRKPPDLAVISRDRGGEYASAAREGAPQAIQCADRFHIVKNLTEAVQVLLARCQAEILAEKKPGASCQDEQNKSIISIEEWRPPEPARARESAFSTAGGPICAVSTSGGPRQAGDGDQRDCGASWAE